VFDSHLFRHFSRLFRFLRLFRRDHAMLIVATAGHIDHGKTSLVRALTGVDTDRLPEERARGISIDLGFAYWEIEPGVLVAFVDVPGHHRFIRNMLAGVAAIDFAMLVVAVDDGVMPQTVEHVQILNYLGVRQGVIVLSKADMAGPDRCAEVAANVRTLLEPTTLAGIPQVVVSARTGDGVPELRALLAGKARLHEQDGAARLRPSRRARFAIDRVFTVRGTGTVVTGTVFDGRIANDDKLTAAPAGTALRVRGIQVHGRAVDQVMSGERAAINVAGVQAQDLARGDWLVDPGMASAGNMLDVSLVLPPDGPALRHASRARLYVGASEVTCRVLLQGNTQVEPGQSAVARLTLDSPVVAVNGDRFVLRDGPGTRTLGGGSVVDPWPATRRKQLAMQEFEALATGVPETALDAMLKGRPEAGTELARFERIFNLTEARCAEALAACGAAVLGKAKPVVVPKARIDALVARAADALKRDQRTSVPITELHAAAAAELPAEAFEFLLRAQAERLDISLAGGAVALRERRDTARNSDEAAWQRIRPYLVEGGIHPPDIADFSRWAGVPVGRLKAILHAQSRAGDIFQLQPDKYLVRELVAQLAATARETSAQFPEGRFTAAQYRDRIGTGRTLAIHVLEMLDAAGITRRIGDQRVMARDPQAVFGPAKAFAAPNAASGAPAKPATKPATKPSPAAARPLRQVRR